MYKDKDKNLQVLAMLQWVEAFMLNRRGCKLVANSYCFPHDDDEENDDDDDNGDYDGGPRTA